MLTLIRHALALPFIVVGGLLFEIAALIAGEDACRLIDIWSDDP